VRAVHGAARAGHRVQATATGAERGDVPQPGGGHAQHHVAGPVDPPAEVEVVAQQRQPGVVAPERGPHVAAHQRTGRGHGEHLGVLPELPEVEFHRVDAGLQVAGGVGGQPRLDHHPRVGPVHAQRAEQRGGRGDLGHREQRVEAVGPGCTVVVQQPHPASRIAPPLLAVRHRGSDGRTEAGVPREREHAVQNVGRAGQELRGPVTGAGVHGNEVPRPDGQPAQRVQHLREPLLAVMADQYAEHRGGARALGPERSDRRGCARHRPSPSDSGDQRPPYVHGTAPARAPRRRPARGTFRRPGA
jgi:hypothetical protein